MSSLRIFIVSRDENLVKTVESLASAHPKLLLAGKSAADEKLIEEVKRSTPDAVLLDLASASEWEEELARSVRRELPQADIVLISEADELAQHHLAAATDARGPITKNQLNEKLPAVLEGVIKRREFSLDMTQQLHLALKAGKMGEWSLDIAELRLHASSQCKANYGRDPREDFTYQKLRESIHLEDRPRVGEAIRRSLEEGEDYAEEYRCIYPNGNVHWVFAVGKTLRSQDGRPMRMVGLTQDITKRKNLEEVTEDNYRRLAEKLEAEVHDRTQQLEQKNIHITKQSEVLQDLSQRLLSLQDDERRRIARELHDSAGQLLSALSMSLGSIAQSAGPSARPIVKQVQESRDMIAQLTQEIRTMSYLLHPPLLDEIGLIAALNWYIRGLMERSGMNIALSVTDEFVRLPRALELIIFRLVQECLTNIHRHSGSNSAVIRLEADAEIIRLEVQDNGKGISRERLREIQSQGSGVGIQGMRERVRQYKGDLRIASDATGTIVSVNFPIPPVDLAEDAAELVPTLH